MRSTGRRYFNAEGIVVRAHDLGEADRIVILFTPNLGLLSCVARGARRTTSRTGGHVDLLRHITAHVSEGRSDLHTLSQVETINAYLPLRRDLDRLSLASHFAEMCERFSLPKRRQPKPIRPPPRHPDSHRNRRKTNPAPSSDSGTKPPS